MTVEYLDLADYLAIAAEVTGLDITTITRVTNVNLADSALHAPSAGFSDVEFLHEFVDKAAVLLVRLAKNHPLPDGNKRAAWVAMRMFIALNGWTWRVQPNIDDAEAIVLGVAAGDVDEVARLRHGYGNTSSRHQTRERIARGQCPQTSRLVATAVATNGSSTHGIGALACSFASRS